MSYNSRKPNNRNNSISLTIASVLGLMMLFSVATGKNPLSILNFAQFNPTQKQQIITDYSNENGYIELKPTNDKGVFTKGSQETIDVIVTLKDKQITGFTIPVEFDPEHYDVVGAETVDTRYNVYFKKEGTKNLILVGVQQSNNTDKIVMYKPTTVGRIIVKTLRGGISDIDVKDKTPKGYELKLNNEKNEPLVPSFGTLQVQSK